MSVDPQKLLRELFDTAIAAAHPRQVLEPYLPADRSGRVIAAMNVSGHSNRFSREAMLEAFLPPLRHAADQINHALLRR